MSRVLSAVVLAAASLSSIGCASMFVPKDRYDRDVAQLKEFNEALARDNAELRPKADEYDKIKTQRDIYADASSTYAGLADSLKKALAGMDIEEGAVTINKQGAYEFSTDVLFDFRSWTLTPKGREILGKVAPTLKGHSIKIVGHTDRKPIVSPEMKGKLETDTNKELSVKRAVAVMGELLKGGLKESNVASVEGHGSDEPKSSDKASRRVEIFVVGGAGSVAPTSAVRPARR